MRICGTQCCAMVELDGLSHTPRPLHYLAKALGQAPGFVLFTEAGRGKYGAALARGIKKHHLGRVVSSKPRTNPNTKNKVTVYLWEVSQAKWRAWVKKHKPKENSLDTYNGM